jgi:hypothetical protein
MIQLPLNDRSLRRGTISISMTTISGEETLENQPPPQMQIPSLQWAELLQIHLSALKITVKTTRQ